MSWESRTIGRSAVEATAAAIKDTEASLLRDQGRAIGFASALKGAEKIDLWKLLEESQRDWLRRESDMARDFRGPYKSIDQEATQPHITNSLLRELIKLQQGQQQKLGAILAGEQAVEQAVAHSTTPRWKTNLSLGVAIVAILVTIYIYLA